MAAVAMQKKGRREGEEKELCGCNRVGAGEAICS